MFDNFEGGGDRKDDTEISYYCSNKNDKDKNDTNNNDIKSRNDDIKCLKKSEILNRNINMNTLSLSWNELKNLKLAQQKIVL